MSHPLNGCINTTLYCGGRGCQSIKTVVKKAISSRCLCKMVVKKANSLRYLRSVLVARSVGGELMHECGAVGRQIMYADRWVLKHRLLIGIFNITTSLRDEGTIVLRSWVLVVENMEGKGIGKTLHCHAFIKDKIERNVGIDQVVIYFSWLQSINQNIFIVQRRIAAKMSYARNGSGGGSGLGNSRFGHGIGHGSVNNLVDSSYKQVVKDIVE